jgi:TRAP transporter 4TM/12TM fusion protein
LPELIEAKNANIDVDELVRKYEVESRFRKLNPLWSQIVMWISIAFSLFHIYAVTTGGIVSFKLRVTHLAFAMLLIVLYYPQSDKSDQTTPTWWDLTMGLAAVGSMTYMLFFFDTMAKRGMTSTTLDLVIGAIAIVCVLETARRCNGKSLPVLSIIFLAYAVLGPWLPLLDHRGYSVTRIIEQMFMGSEGIFGVPLGVSADTIFVYILFGAILAETGVSRVFANIAMALAGHTTGGPARVAVASSAFFGMISGSAAANAISIGSVTIPLMKATGYSPMFAAAVEATASTGGQIMPPIMGAAAFIMAEYLGVSYGVIALAAAIPALLYFWSIWVQVGFEARREGLKPIARDRLPKMLAVLKDGWFLLLPVVVLLLMLALNYTPALAAIVASASAVAVSWLKKETRMTLPKLAKALVTGARGALTVAAATAVVGLVIGVFSMTGLALRLANLILDLSFGNIHLLLLLTAVAALMLGLGLPTSATYIMTATAAAPALIKGGIPPLYAHMFVFYFGVLAAITPPDALAAYAAASIAGADPWKVGWKAVWLGMAGYLVPFMMIYWPGLLLRGSTMEIIMSTGFALLGVYTLGAALENFLEDHCKLWERIALFASALLFVAPGAWSDIAGLLLVGGIWFVQRRRAKQRNRTLEEVTA